LKIYDFKDDVTEETHDVVKRLDQQWADLMFKAE
jgi:dynein heavy chain, axonemal